MRDKPEAGPQRPEEYLDGVLKWRPPLPVDRANYSGLFKELRPSELQTTTAPGYAWEGLPRWLAEKNETFRRTGRAPKICLDLCSSLPWNAQQMRAEEFRAAGETASELTWRLFSGDWLLLHPIEDAELLGIHHAAGRNKVGRQLVEAAIQTVLYTLNSDDTAGGEDEELERQCLTERFVDVLFSQSVTIDREQSGRNLDTRWGISFTSKEQGVTYFETLTRVTKPTDEAVQARERLQAAYPDLHKELDAIDEHLAEALPSLDPAEQKLAKTARNKAKSAAHARFNEAHQVDLNLAQQSKLVSEEEAAAYLNWQAESLASMVVDNQLDRIARFLSMDISDPADIANSSLDRSLPLTRNTNLHSHAIESLFDPNQHIVGNMFEPLPVPDNSCTLITCYDAWPLDSSFDGLTPEQIDECIRAGVERLWHFYQKLAYGGKLIIFPWATAQRNEESARILKQVWRRMSVLTGHGVDIRGFHPVVLQVLMTSTERVTADLFSTIFSPDNLEVEALIIDKPDKKLVDVHARARRQRGILSLLLKSDFELWAGQIPSSDDA